MSNLEQLVATQLETFGFRKRGADCFASPVNPRVVALAVTSPDPSTWSAITEDLLRSGEMRQTSSWARYVLLVVDAPKSLKLSWAATAFAQDVSRCRRIVVFRDALERGKPALPFLRLGSTHDAERVEIDEWETSIRNQLSPSEANVLLDEAASYSSVQQYFDSEDSL